MSYILQGQTTARYGNPHHQHTLAGGELRFYGVKKSESGKTKWSWNTATESDVGAPLLGRGLVEPNGSYTAKLEKYDGGPVLVVLSVKKFSYAPSTGKQAFGLLGVATPTTSPRAGDEPTGDDQPATPRIDVDLPKSSYCAILEALDLWLVSGRVTDCETREVPFIGGVVDVFDRDISQDDFLGQAPTDGSGSFSVFFQSSVFKGIPVLPPPWDLIPPHELFGGPDVFFHVTSGATKILEETPAQGRNPGRENVSNCSFHELCVKAPVWTPQNVTLWNKIGLITVPDGGGLHDFDAEGFVNSGKLAFTGNIDLHGQISQTYLGQPVSFRFVVAEWANMTTAPAYPADYSPLTAANLTLNRAYGQIYTFLGPSPWDYTLTPVLPAPDAAGWIAVDQNPNFIRTSGDAMVQLRTGTLVPAVGSASAMEGLTDAGDPVPAGPLRDRPRKYSLVLEIRTPTTTAVQPVPVPIHINNSLVYLRYDLTELQANACSPITQSGGSITVHPAHTVAHPYLQYYTINVQRQGGVNLVATNEQYTAHASLWTGPTGEFGTNAVNYTDVGPCSYRSSVVADRRLTNGYGGVGHQNILRTFCVD